MVQILFILIISILIADFALERFLSFLNIKQSGKELPIILQDIYDTEKYNKQQNYFRTNSKFGMISSSFSFLITLVMILFGGFAWLDSFVSQYVQHSVWTPVVFFGILYFANDIISIPFSLYDIFVIEERFGFNKITPKLFILDKLKSYGMTIFLGGGILSLIVWIYTLTPDYFWLLAWGVITIFSLFMTMFYSQLIVPLFNKQTPLKEGELRSEIQKFALKTNFNLDNIYVIDGSKRSTKANAYFSGLGAKKRIVLYDTLIEKMTINEIISVLAHEIGHYKHKHTIKNFLISMPTTMLLFFIFGWILQSDELSKALGGVKATFHLNALAFSILYSPISLVFDTFSNYLSRRFEYQADNYASSHGYGSELITGIKKLTATSLGNLMPHPLYVFFHYSHPTLYQRMMNLSTRI